MTQEKTSKKKPAKITATKQSVASKKATTPKKPETKKSGTEKTAPKKNNIKDIRMILIWDASGSMASLRQDAIGSFNTIINDQKLVKTKAKTRLTLVTFNESTKTVYGNVPLEDIPELTQRTYEPCGVTALLDAVGYTLTTALVSVNDGEETIVTILTDGQENASKNFSKAKVKELVDKAKNLGWDIIFLGANIDSFAEAGQMNIDAGHSANMDFSSTGFKAAALSINTMVRSKRGALSANETETLRQKGIMDSDGTISNLTAVYNDAKKQVDKQ